MNKRQILASLNNIANSLDYSGLYKESATITKVMVKLAEEETESYGKEPAKKIIDDFVDQAKRNERYDPSILKMMNDRLEFNGHERMSEKKFKEMIGKNKEANSNAVMKRLAEEEKMMTSVSEEELNNAMSEEGIQKAFEQYKSKGGSASQESFASQWKPLIERMLNGFSNNMGVSIAEEKYKRKNPFWDPRD